MKHLKCWGMALLLTTVCMALTACGDDKEKELDINSVLPGTWVLDTTQGNGLGYEIQVGDEGYDLLWHHLDFHADHTFFYQVDLYESHEGTYEAGRDYIRCDYADAELDTDMLLFQVHSFTERTLCVSYRNTEHDITAKVWLVKQ